MAWLTSGGGPLWRGSPPAAAPYGAAPLRRRPPTAWLTSDDGAPSISPPPGAKLGPIPAAAAHPIPSASVLSAPEQRVAPGSQSVGLGGYAFPVALLTPIHRIHRPPALLRDAAKNQIAGAPNCFQSLVFGFKKTAATLRQGDKYKDQNHDAIDVFFEGLPLYSKKIQSYALLSRMLL
ncbi:uncharacterized protein [Miscanthus floridulus]|uniref:uncharacterized protein n=1 Tax=Miscanthus floridulus TaxID=154761 RepID=UPI003458E73E